MINLTKRIKNFNLIYNMLSETFYGKCELKFEMSKVYEKYLKKIINSKSEKEYYLLLAEFLRLFDDGHTDINFSKKILNKIGYLPFSLYNVKGSYYIGDTIEELKHLKFEKIKSINGISFTKLKKICSRYIHSVEGFLYRGKFEKFLPFFLKKRNNVMIINDNKFKFDLLKEKQNFNNIYIKPKDGFVKISSNFNEIYITNDNILYVYIDTFNNVDKTNELVDILKKQEKLKAVILDVRNNEGGMTLNAEKIASFFIKGKFKALNKKTRISNALDLASARLYNLTPQKAAEYISKGITTKEKINKSIKILNGDNFECYSNEFGGNNKFYFDCDCYILTSRYTVSAGDDFVAMFKANNVGLIVGDITYGSTGTPYTLKLDDGSIARSCTVKCSLIDDTEFINIGIKPHVCISNSIKDYRKNNDKVLNYVLNKIKEKYGK